MMGITHKNNSPTTTPPDYKSLSALYNGVLRRQTELEVEVASLQTKLAKCSQENSRLENEKTRTLSLYKQQQDELSEMQMQHERDLKTICLLKSDLDKLYLSFKNYQESKDKEIGNLLIEKVKLETTLSKFSYSTHGETSSETDSYCRRSPVDAKTTLLDNSEVKYLKSKLKQIRDMSNELIDNLDETRKSSSASSTGEIINLTAAEESRKLPN